MKHLSMASVLLVSTLLAACGGNGSTSPVLGPGPVTNPGPTSPTSPVSPNSVLQTATINGQQDFITSSQLAVYTFSSDTPNQSNCTAANACLTVWPIVAPPAGVTLSPPWGSFVRSDNGQTQLTYNGSPLYTFASDTAQKNATGDTVQNFHLLHPAATMAPQPAPSQAPATMAPVAPATQPPAQPTNAPLPPGY
jgi:predicted lipoprotein with Yx(FWY)xxD motif